MQRFPKKITRICTECGNRFSFNKEEMIQERTICFDFECFRKHQLKGARTARGRRKEIQEKTEALIKARLLTT